jgi:hypothetical protein
MKRTGHKAQYLDELIDEITMDANGEDEQLWAFRQAFESGVRVPCDATVVGELMHVLNFDYDGNVRRGLTAVCRAADGRKHVVAASDLAVSPRAQAGRYLAAYRKWMGLKPFPSAACNSRRQSPSRAAETQDAVELVVLSMKQNAARCRFLGSVETLTFRAAQPWGIVPGEIVAVRPAKRWTYAGRPYISGMIESARLDVMVLGLLPLRVEQRGIWKPEEHDWGEEGDPIEDWAKPIIARGPRPEFEMEQVLPGADSADPFSDPITESNGCKDAGDWPGVYKILMDLCKADLRCLDAQAHLGNTVFDHRPEDAIRHYEVGFRIGELSLGQTFEGVLPWGWIDNRPFLRCMHGFGLCLCRLGRFEEAASIFDRMLWLNPTDNQGVRFVLPEVLRRGPWHAD